MIKIKQTKSVEMYYYPDTNEVSIEVINENNKLIYIPMSKIFQVQRGLTSAIQRYYRRKNAK